MSEAENPEGTQQDQAPAGPEFGDYDTNIVQLSDTEIEGVPYEEIVDQYEEGDVDAIVYAGDASRKTADPDSYLQKFEETYDNLSKIQEELDTEVLVEPGNHSPISGSHNAGGWGGAESDEEYVDEVEKLLDKQYEEFSETDQNAYEFLVDEYDLTNIEYDSVDVGDITVVGGTHHDGELDKKFEKEWLESDVDTDDLDYESDDLEEIAGNLSGGYLSRIVNTISFGFFGTPKKSKDDVGLVDIPDNLKSEAHEAYEEAIELKEYFEDAIESAENDVFLTHHGIPTSFSEDYGSKVVGHVMEDYSDDIVGVGGGHTGTPGIEEDYGVPTVNTNDGAVVELGYNESGLEHADSVIEPASRSPQQPSQEEVVRNMEQVGGPDEFYQQAVKPQIDQLAQRDDVDQETLEDIREQKKGKLEDLWASKDDILGQEEPDEAAQVEA